MPLIVWDDKFNVNIGEIDRQHQQLVNMVNKLNDAMRQGKGKEILAGTLSGLISYTRTHFGTEEKYFERFAYPDTAAHLNEHQAFVAKVVDFNQKFTAGQIGLTIELMNFLSDWLVKHIQGSDKKYGPFLNSKGLN